MKIELSAYKFSPTNLVLVIKVWLGNINAFPVTVTLSKKNPAKIGTGADTETSTTYCA